MTKAPAESPAVPAANLNNAGWRRAIADRVRSGRSSLVYCLVWALFAVAFLGTIEGAVFSLAWLALGLGVFFLEARALRRILRRRRVLGFRDRAMAFAWSALSGSVAAIMVVAITLSGALGSNALAMLLFFAMAIHFLPAFRDVWPLYVATVGPGFLAVLVPRLTWLIREHDAWNLALVIVLASVLVFIRIYFAARKFGSNALSLQLARQKTEREAEAARLANRAKSDFLAVISHELRTPMNAMLGSAELLRRTDLSLEQRGHLEAMLQGGNVLMTLLNDMLDMARIESGALATEAIPVEIRSFALELQCMWRARAQERDLVFEVMVDPALPDWVLIDPTRLRQVIVNLLSNAMKFTQAGGVQLVFRAEDRADGARLLITEVRDTGPGIPPDVAARLFRPFQQADSSTARRFGGTGLGLSICKGLSEAMGGKILLECKPQEGAVFRVQLPLRAAEEREPKEAPEEDVELGAVQILVAEDNPANRRLLGALLQPMGLEVIMACDGNEAVELFELEEFDAVLMDIQMPGMDGIEATRVIRESSDWGRRAPIIALTANATEEDRRRCLEAGMNDFVTKPIDPRALHAVIVRAIAQSRLGGPQQELDRAA